MIIYQARAASVRAGMDLTDEHGTPMSSKAITMIARMTDAHGEQIRVSIGAVVGLLITGFVCKLAFGSIGDLPSLVAPTGASTVLLFAAPQSPLARPWCCIGGNTVSALVGVTCAGWIGDPLIARPLPAASRSAS